MIKVTLIALGKLKEKYLRDAVDEYSKRLSRYCKLDIIEITPLALHFLFNEICSGNLLFVFAIGQASVKFVFLFAL